MTLRSYNLKKLQPTDLSEDSLPFLMSLSNREIEKLNQREPPQVWKTIEGRFISDGNTRLAVLALRGQKRAIVDYKDETTPMYHIIYESEEYKNGQLLRQKGIKSPYDFWKSP